MQASLRELGAGQRRLLRCMQEQESLRQDIRAYHATVLKMMEARAQG